MTTPRPKATTSSKKVSVRIAARGAEVIRDRADGADITASHMARRMLDYALRHMPADYLPQRAGASPPGKRVKLGVRIPAAWWATICDRAAAADVKPSHMIRRMFDYALRHQPGRFIHLGPRGGR